MKRKLILFVAVILLLSMALSACGGNGEDMQSTNEVQTIAEDNEAAFLNGLDFNEKVIRINTRDDNDAIVEIGIESDGSVLSEALHKRTLLTEERLNVKIECCPQETWSKYNETINRLRTTINAGDGAYDIVAGWSSRIVALTLEGLFLNLNDTAYYNSDNSWWSKSITQALTVNGKIYLNTGDIAATYMDNCYAVIANQELSKNYLGYDYTKFYETVDAGEWTIEYFHQLVKDGYTDDGDLTPDVDDIYGLVCSKEVGTAFWSSCGISIISNNGRTTPMLNFNVDKIQSAANLVYELFYNNEGSDISSSGQSRTSDDMKRFQDSKSIFTIQRLGYLDALTDTSFTYGVLPIPKYDNEQQEYYTYIQQSVSLWCIPIDVSSADASSATMSSLGYDSKENVIVPHYETLLKLRYVHDSETGKMIDIIYNGIFMNFDSLFNECLAKSVSATERGSMPVYIFWQMGSDTPPNISRWWQQYGSGLENYLNNILTKYQ